MKKILIVFLTLLTVFFGAWGIKSNKPVGRPADKAEASETYWYNASYTSPVADSNWVLDETIPDNYVPVPGSDELYMVIDDNGSITQYRQREKDKDGKWVWQTVNPDIPENYEPVEGKENVYKVTDEEENEYYVLYIRNEDDTYSFVGCDINGTPLDIGSDATVVDSGRYVKQTEDTYAMYDENGVLIGYRERVPVEDENGNTSYIWAMGDIPDFNSSVLKLAGIEKGKNDTGNTPVITGESITGIYNLTPTPEATPAGIYVTPIPELNKTDNGDGTYTETSRSVETRTESGYQVTYETMIYKVYDVKSGELVKSWQEGPVETNRVKLNGSDAVINKSLIENTLTGEHARVTAGLTMDTKKADKIVAEINAMRINSGLSGLAVTEDARLLAEVRAADMAVYNHSSNESPMYGKLEDMIVRWGINVNLGYENVLRTTVRDAVSIVTRFKGDEASRQNMLSANITSIGVGVVEKDGQDFVAIVFFG